MRMSTTTTLKGVSFVSEKLCCIQYSELQSWYSLGRGVLVGASALGLVLMVTLDASLGGAVDGPWTSPWTPAREVVGRTLDGTLDVCSFGGRGAFRVAIVI